MAEIVVLDGEIELTEVIDGEATEVIVTGGGGGIIPTGTINITENGLYSVYTYANADVEVEGLVPTGTLNIAENGSYEVTEYANVDVGVYPSLQSKTVTPTEQEQAVLPDSNYYGLSDVTVRPIPEEYIIPSGTITLDRNGLFNISGYANADIGVYPVLQRKSATPTEQEQVVEADSQYYGLSAVTVNAIPSQYIVPSGSLNITENGTFNVRDKATAIVNVPDLYGNTLKETLDGTLTELSNTPSGLYSIKPYAFCTPIYVPDGYTQVEYVSSTTSVDFQLDTGIFTDGVIEAELVARGNATPGNSQIVFSSGTGGNAGTWFGSSSNNLWAFGAAEEARSTIPYTTKITAYLKTWRDTVNHIRATVVGGGRTETISRDGASTASMSNIVLFATATSGVVTQLTSLYGSNARIYSCKIWKDGILVANYVPCQNAEGIYGLYDTVRQMFTAINNRLTGGSAVTPIPSEVGALQTVDLPSSVVEIGDYAFYNNDLSSLTLRAEQVVSLGENALAHTPIASGTGYIYVPSDLLSAYQSAADWAEYTSQIRAI